MWDYVDSQAMVRDALRLSQGMSYKNAMADLPLGGGKSVIWGNAKTDKSPDLFRAFGRAVESLSGNYWTAEDVGLTPQDLDGAAMALLFPEHISHIQVRSVFAAAGCSYDWKFELQTFHSGCQFVEAGLCYMICDMITAHSQMHLGPSGIVFRPFRPRISAPLSIITPAFSPLSLVASEFSRYLTAELERLQQEVAESMGAG